MTQKFYLLSKSLLTKIALVAALMSWGGIAAEADDYSETLTFDNSTIPSGWTNGGKYGSQTFSSFTLNDGYIETANTFGTFSLTSNSTDLSISSGQKIVVKAKVKSGYSNTYQKVQIYYSNDGSSYSLLKGFTHSDFSSQTDYADLEYSFVSDYASCGLQFRAQAAVISRIEIQSASGETLDEVILDETGINNTDFSSLTSKTKIPAVKVLYTPVRGWNSICMPFELKDRTSESTYLTTIFGSGWRAYQFSSYSDGIITFTERTAMLNMPANKPYLVYTENPQSVPVGGFEFEDVDVTYSSNPKTTNDATFQGTYAPIAAGSMPVGSYGLTPSGQIRPAGSKSSLKGYRAYFTGVSAPSGGSDVRLFILDGDETTDVGLFKMVEGEEHRVFNLNGQEVQKAKKGLYIVNGKKIVIK